MVRLEVRTISRQLAALGLVIVVVVSSLTCFTRNAISFDVVSIALCDWRKAEFRVGSLQIRAFASRTSSLTMPRSNVTHVAQVTI